MGLKGLLADNPDWLAYFCSPFIFSLKLLDGGRKRDLSSTYSPSAGSRNREFKCIIGYLDGGVTCTTQWLRLKPARRLLR